VLFYANEESRGLKNRFVSPEHILMGILREERSIAAEVLFQFGLRIQDIRETVTRQNNDKEF
jgi:ATP-dependent Clp protease ATP-binding subunit ClpC